MARAGSAVRPLVGCALVVLTLGALCGCGGKAHGSDAGPVQSSTGGGSAGSSGGSATGATAGSEGQGETPPLEDVFPWFDGSGTGNFSSGPDDVMLHLVASGVPARATLSTHNVFDLLSTVSAIEFSARASAPVRLLVCASNSVRPYDYFSARDAGQQWPLAPADVAVEWHDFSVPLTDMMPPDVGDADGIPSFFLAFIVEHPEPVEVWLDDVRFVR